jgi:hypothetical protein
MAACKENIYQKLMCTLIDHAAPQPQKIENKGANKKQVNGAH